MIAAVVVMVVVAVTVMMMVVMAIMMVVVPAVAVMVVMGSALDLHLALGASANAAHQFTSSSLIRISSPAITCN